MRCYINQAIEENHLSIAINKIAFCTLFDIVVLDHIFLFRSFQMRTISLLLFFQLFVAITI